jgi:hypothetical protein
MNFENFKYEFEKILGLIRKFFSFVLYLTPDDWIA